MPQQAILDMLRPQRFPQQGVVPQVNHAHRQVIAGSPVGMELA